MTIGDRAEFELGKNECCITCSNHLLAQDKILFKANQFLLVSHENNTKTNEKIIFLSDMVNMIRKKGMHFTCVSYAFLFFFQNKYLATKLIYFTKPK